MQEQSGFKKHAECSNPNKPGRAYMYYFNTIYAPGQHDNGYMATGAIGNTHVQLHVTGIQVAKEYSSYH